MRGPELPVPRQPLACRPPLVATATTAAQGHNWERVDYYTLGLRLRDLLSHLPFNQVSVEVQGVRRSDRGWVMDAEVRWAASSPE